MSFLIDNFCEISESLCFLSFSTCYTGDSTAPNECLLQVFTFLLCQLHLCLCGHWSLSLFVHPSIYPSLPPMHYVSRSSRGPQRPIRTSPTTCGRPRSASCSPAPRVPAGEEERASLTTPTATAPSWGTPSPTSLSSSP